VAWVEVWGWWCVALPMMMMMLLLLLLSLFQRVEMVFGHGGV